MTEAGAPGLFVSMATHFLAMEAVGISRILDDDEVATAVRAAAATLSGSWEDIDGLYLAVQTLGLHRRDVDVPLPAPLVDVKALPTRARFSLDADIVLLPPGGRRGIPDERMVAALVGLRRSLDGLVPFTMAPQSIRVAREAVGLTFDVFMPPLPDPDGIGQEALAPGEGGVLRGLLSGPGWEALGERYGARLTWVGASAF